MDNKIKAVFAVNPKNEDIAFEKIVSNNVKEDEPIFYIDNEIMLQNPFDTEENRAMLYAKTIESCERQIQSLKAEKEKLRKILSDLVEDIDTPYKLGLGRKPNPLWANLNKARQTLKELK